MSTLIMKLSDMGRVIVSIKGLFWLSLLCFPALLLYGFFYSDELLFHAMQMQQKMHRELATLLQQVKQNPGEYGPTLMLVSFLYGIFHAAGPGHGKMIIATYMGTQVASLKKGVQLSFMAAFLQASVAILLVTALVRLLELSMRQSQWVGAQFEAISYLLVAVMGFVVCLKQYCYLRQKNKAHQHQPLADGGCSCGHKHMPLPEEVEQGGLKETIGIMLSMGFRPCTGALLVLMLANALGLYWYGVSSSLLMALGTAMTVSTIAFLSVSLRNYVGQLMRLYQKTESTESNARWINILGILGGVLLILLGSGLFWSFLQLSQQRPF